MKNGFLVIVFILFSYTSYCQFHIDLGGGVSVKKEVYGKGEVSHQVFPNLEIVAAYDAKYFVIQGEMKPSITRNNSASSYFGGAAGFKFRNVTLEGGVYRNIISEDDPSLNRWNMGASLEYFGRLMKRGGIYGKVMYINNGVIFTAGCRVNFN